MGEFFVFLHKSKVRMKNKYSLIFIIFWLGYFNLTHAQYVWEEVIIPDSIGAGSMCFFEDDVYLATGNGVYHSNDNCDSWEFIGIQNYPIWSIYISSSGKLYAGASSHLYNYLGESTWSLLYSPIDATNIMSIFVSDSSYIYFGNWGGVFRSVDDGVNWNEVLDCLNTEVIRDIIQDNNGVLFGGTRSFSPDISPGGCYRSMDNGASWDLVGLHYKDVSSLLSINNNTLFAAVRFSGVFKSVDSGESWTQVYTGVSASSITKNQYDELAFCCHGEGYPYGGIYFSHDEGETWEEITGDLPDYYFNHVYYDPNNILYAISNGSKLYRTINPVVNLNNNECSKVLIYPNPTNNFLEIEASNEIIPSFKLLNTCGQVVYEKANLIGSTRLDLSNFVRGIYIVQYYSKGESYNQIIIKN